MEGFSNEVVLLKLLRTFQKWPLSIFLLSGKRWNAVDAGTQPIYLQAVYERAKDATVFVADFPKSSEIYAWMSLFYHFSCPILELSSWPTNCNASASQSGGAATTVTEYELQVLAQSLVL